MKKKLLSIILLISSLILCSCQAETTIYPNVSNVVTYNPSSSIKIGVLYKDSILENTNSFLHNEGILQMKFSLGLLNSQILTVENVETECEDTIKSLIAQGCTVIYGTSYDFAKSMEIVSLEYPNIIFSNVNSEISSENFKSYTTNSFESSYLCGIVAGMNTINNRIGYVASVNTTQVISQINAFALGVAYVNPNAVIELRWANSPSLQEQATTSLVSKNADIIIAHCDSFTVQQTSDKLNVFYIGNSTDSNEFCLASPSFNWHIFYTKNVQSILDDNWNSDLYLGGLNDKSIYMDFINTDIAIEGTASEIYEIEEKIKSRELNIFTGPISCNKGNVIALENEQLQNSQIFSNTWLLHNISGSVK